MILTSPRCSLADLAENIRQAFAWTLAGCEVGMYPYVIPFSGAAMARDPELAPHVVSRRQHVAGTDVVWDQPAKIPPIDPVVRRAILSIEVSFERWLDRLQARTAHLPSRVRSLLWVVCSIPVLSELGEPMPDRDEAVEHLAMRLSGLDGLERARLPQLLDRGRAAGMSQVCGTA